MLQTYILLHPSTLQHYSSTHLEPQIFPNSTLNQQTHIITTTFNRPILIHPHTHRQNITPATPTNAHPDTVPTVPALGIFVVVGAAVLELLALVTTTADVIVVGGGVGAGFNDEAAVLFENGGTIVEFEGVTNGAVLLDEGESVGRGVRMIVERVCVCVCEREVVPVGTALTVKFAGSALELFPTLKE